MGVDCLQVFEDEGALREATANRPLLLAGGDVVWLVAAGRVDVFAVPLRKGEVAGTRTHLFRAEAGQALFGMDLEGGQDGQGLLAVGIASCRLVRVPRARLAALAGNASAAGPVRALVECWLEQLTASVAGDVPPRKAISLEAGREVILEEGGKLLPGGVLWVRGVEGDVRFLGNGGLALGGCDGLFPVAAPGWLEAGPRSRLATAATEAVLADPSLWAGLGRFHQAAMACLVRRAWEAAETERERLARQAEADRRLADAALTRLASVTAPAARELPATPEADGLLAACRLLGRHLGIPFQPAPGAKEGRGQAAAVAALARASRVRVRRVVLRGDWWRGDSGPLLAFLVEGDRPVALLPASPARYELADPAAPTRQPVTAAVAAALAPFAYTFYCPLPARALRAGDLVRLGLHGCGRDLWAVVLLGLVGGLLGLLAPVATGVIVETIIPGAEYRQLGLIGLGLVTAAVAAALVEVTRNVAIVRVESKADAAVEAGLWDRLLALPAPFFRRFTAGDLAGRALGVGAMRQLLTGVAVSSLLGSLFSFCALGLLFFYDVPLAVAATGLVLAVLGVTAAADYLQLGYVRAQQETRGKVAGLVLQVITGIARLRVARAEDRALARWADGFSTQQRLALQARSVANGLAVVQAGTPLVASAVLFAAAAARLEDGLSAGAFLALSAAFGQALTGALALGTALGSLLRVVPLYERLRPILEEPPEADPARHDPGELRGEVEINHVSFRYHPDGPLILDGVSVHIRPGEFVAFVGPSGSGKSTLLRLLLGFEAPQAGSVYYDRQDLAGLDLQAVRRQLGVVLQSGKVMAGSVLDNILGASLLTLEDAWEAARLSGLEEDIRQMPMGMHTIVPEGGNTFSGGQRQRLLIARAVVSRPRLLLFDEATSALDNQTQAIVSRSLEGLHATRIVIAHRLSTIQNADRIYVLEGGKVVQQGRYDELAGQPGLFADLAKRQLV
jgi:NHLM bacteriocin system ABC transporter ATP-binding protein